MAKHFELGAHDGELDCSTMKLSMYEQFGSTMITDFPEMTSPFWNMSRYEDGRTFKARLMCIS